MGDIADYLLEQEENFNCFLGVFPRRRGRIPKFPPKFTGKVFCDYCGAKAELKDSSEIYGNAEWARGKKVWVCSRYPECDAYVGAHSATQAPLGRLADPMLRQWKKMAHVEFDALWKEMGMERGEAYEWMQNNLNLSPEEAHIGKFDVEMCQSLIRAVQEYRRNKRN